MFSGYRTQDLTVKLNEREELDKAFTFVESISDIIPNKAEMFGIFSSNPEKVMLLPGLEVR